MEEKELLIMESDEEAKKEDKKVLIILKKLWNKLDKKRFVFLTLFFLFLYFVSEFLNGNDVIFTKIFGFSADLEERVKFIKSACYDFFKFPKFLANYFLFVFLYWIIYGITNRTKFTCAFLTIFTYVFGVINYIVTEIRGISITISDIYSIKTAMNVASGIKPSVEGNFIVATILFVFMMLVLWRIKIKEKKETRTTRAKLFGIVLGVFGILVLFGPNYITDGVELWNINRAYANSGMGLTIVRMAKDIKVSKPKNYSKNEVINILNSYKDDTAGYTGEEEYPNVLVVMNESFSDLAKSYELNLPVDPIETLHSLVGQEDVISGTMHSSQFGGGTANIEWEFLTQNVTAFLPSGSMPYQQYISNEVKTSLVSYMNNFNYTTYGIHSWDKSGYSREKIYNKFLKFDHSMFKDSMTKLDYGWREYPADWSVYEEYYDIMRNKGDENNFTFLVTMENHTPYNKTDPDGITFSETDSELNSYLQLEYGSDKALGLLIDFVKNYDEKLIMLFFGDHQPNVGQNDNYNTTGVYSEDESSHVVPFFIYANYDIEEQSDLEISPNYLQSLLLETANMPTNSYTKYIQELKAEIPVITNLYYKDNDGNTYKVKDEKSPYYDKIQEYWRIIYYNMFEK